MPTAPSRDTNDSTPTNGNGNGDGPRRSSLVQERSRRTRQELVNAAVKLWTERVVRARCREHDGRGDRACRRRHQGHLLLPLRAQRRRAARDEPHDERRGHCDRPSVRPRAAPRSTRSSKRRSPRWRGAPSASPAPRSCARSGSSTSTHPRPRAEHDAAAWPELLADAQARGELPTDIDPADLSDMMNALMITAVEGWVHGAHDALAPELAYRMRVLLAGVRAEHAG